MRFKLKLPNLASRVGRKRALIMSLVGGASFIGLITLTLGYFTTNGSCTIACHSMRPQAESLSRSAHSEIQCMACHAPPGGALALTMEHVVASRFVPMEFFLGFHKPINSHSEVSTHIEDERCYRCHNLATRNVSATPGILMTSEAHLKHLQAGLHCTTCHNRVAHSAMDDPAAGIEYDRAEEGAEFKYDNYMDMKKGCLRCHSATEPYKSKKNGAVAPGDCTTCHPADWNKMPVGHDKKWAEEHGGVAKQNFASCLKKSSDGTTGCHAANAKFNHNGEPLCVRCHKGQTSKFLSLAGVN